MPGHNGGWLHQSQTVLPPTPETTQKDPEDTVDGPNLGPRTSMYQARELLAQRNVLGDEICAVLEDDSSNGEKQCNL